MTKRQAIALILAAGAVTLAAACPPYYDSGGIIGGTVYFPFRPPPSDPYISFNGWLFRWELAYIGVTAVTALMALGRRARRLQTVALLVGLAVEAAFFVSQFPRLLLAPEFTWYGLTLMAVMLLIAVTTLGRRNTRKIPKVR